MLEQSQVIRKRVVLVDPKVVDLNLTAIVLIRTLSHAEDWLARFKAVVERFPEITSAHRMSGDLDYVLRVRVADVAACDAFYKRLIAQIDIADISASFVMEDLKDTTALPI